MTWLYVYLGSGVVCCAAFFTLQRPSFESRRSRAVAIALGTLLWPLVVYVLLDDWRRSKAAGQPVKEREPFAVRVGDLGEPISIEALEARERVEDPLGAVPDLPFGHLNPGWERFKAQLEPSSLVAPFAADYETWCVHRYEGYAEVGEGRVERWFIARIYLAAAS